MPRKPFPAILISAAMLGASPALARPPVAVTRFHPAQMAPPGDIAIVPADGGDVQSLEFQSYVAPIAAELTRLGYHVVSGPDAPLIATVEVRREMRDGPPRSSGLSIGIGGGFGGGGYRSGGGIGGGVGFPIGGSRPTSILSTELSVQLRDRTTQTAYWEGHAGDEVRGGSRDASPDVETARLAGALFEGFPGESGRTIRVK